MVSEITINRLENMLTEVIDFSGTKEQTTIVSNMVVVNASPSGSALSGFVTITDERDGDTILAKTVPGITYANGDLVNVLFIDGTEPIAFQQASASGGVGFSVDRIFESDFGGIAGQSDATGNFTWNHGVVINDNGEDEDSRIAGNNETNLFYVDAGNDRIGIHTSTPDGTFEIEETYTDSTTHTAAIVEQTWSPSGTAGGQFPTAMTLLATYDTTHSPASGFLTSFRLFAAFADSGILNLRNIDIRSSNNGAGTVADARDINIRTAVNNGGGAITSYRSINIENQTVGGTNHGIYQNGSAVENYFAGRLSVGVTTASGKAHIDQESTTAAIPTLQLRQRDISEEFLFFQGSAAAATLTQSIVAEADVTTATRQGFIKVEVQDDGNQIADQAYFMALYTLA